LPKLLVRPRASTIGVLIGSSSETEWIALFQT
jgi:hypothetical protein